MSPLSPEELLDLLRSARDASVSINADNLAAAAKLLIDKRIRIERGQHGMLIARLIREH
jgi:hypothetical protein